MESPKACLPASTLLLTPIAGTNRYQLAAPWQTRIACPDGKRRVIVVPGGFETDGASIPRPLWRHIGHPFTPAYARASVVHDYLYRVQTVDRAEADRVFHRLLRRALVSSTRARVMWLAVRLFGGFAWRRRARYLQLNATRRRR